MKATVHQIPAVFDVIRHFKKSLRRLARCENAAVQGPQDRNKIAFLRKRLRRMALSFAPFVRPTQALWALLAAAPAGVYAQTPQISSLTPSTNAIAVARNSNIDITFSIAMSSATLNAGTIRIYGSQTGFLSTSGTFSGNPALSFDPTTNFKPGEIISVSVTGATSSGGQPITGATVYSFSAAAQGGSASFVTSTFSGNGFTRGAVIGDLDGDGDLDAFIVKSGISTELWLNNGDGSFTSSTHAGSFARDAALGDLDGDGDLDAIQVDYNGSHTFLINNGDATFSSSTIAVGINLSSSVDVGDLDGDGDLDAIIAHGNGAAKSILLNNGDGTFTSSAFDANRSNDVKIGDIDNDGDLDAVFSSYLSGAHHAWLNNGDGTFVLTTFGSHTRGRNLQLGDLDGDGDLDAVVSIYTAGTGPQEVWLNNGDGTFASAAAPTGNSRALAMGDLDGDGDLDIINVPYAGSYERRLWLNNGDASFVVQSLGSGNLSGLDFGDLDGDGDLDAIAVFGTSAREVWLNSNTEPTLTSINPTCIIQNSGPAQVALSGSQFETTTAQISALNSFGVPIGQQSLAILSSSATDIIVEVPNLALATVGTLTVTVSNSISSTSTTLTVNPAVSVTGANCGCPGVALTYTAEPQVTSATDTWTVNGGTIISGQGTGSVQVVWDQGAAVSLGVARTYLSGCTTAALLNVAPKTLIAALDFAQVATNASVTLAVLSNDSGSNITIQSVADPDNGTAEESGGNVVYTPDAGFSGGDTFAYTIEDDQGCRATGAIVVTVVGTSQTVSLAIGDIIVNGMGGVVGLQSPVAASVSHDGRHVYAAGQLSSSVAVFTRNSGDGSLTFNGAAVQGQNGIDGLSLASDVALSPDGAHVYAVGAGSDGVAVFSRNISTGALTYVESKLNGASDAGGTIAGLERPTAIAVSPDGSYVYAAGYDANSIVIFRRIPVVGTLIYVGTISNGSDGVTDLRQITSLASSPDGAHIYATGSKDNSVAVFSRNVSTGALTFVERLKDGMGGVNGLRGASSCAVSSDGRNVYVTGPKDKAVAVFSRDASTGALTFIEDHIDGFNGVNGLAGAFRVSINPAGTTVFVAGEQASAVCVFRRDPASGALAFTTRLVDNSGGVNGLDRIRDIVISPDGKHIYCVGMFDNALVSFTAE